MINEKELRKSFQRIKKDMQVLSKRDEFIATEISNIRTGFNNLKDEIHDQSFVEKLANSIIEKIESRLKTVKSIDDEPPETVETMPETSNNNPIPNHIDSTMFLKQKIKSKIVKLCEQRVRPSDLKKSIVDMTKLCSKATFYRYISELKRGGIIQAIELNNEAFLIATEALLDRNIYK
jgi:hypothetical protein